MASAREVEIKFALEDIAGMERRLRRAGFRRQTPRTHEVNTLYDLPGGALRSRRELLRLRDYGGKWKLTHKSKPETGRHKSREEHETSVADGKQMEAILRALGFAPSFQYEKFRSEWADGTGHVVLDETPIGNFGEIEGPARWIDRTAHELGIIPSEYITASYAQLFFDWKAQTGSPAEQMTFREVKRRKKA